MLLSNGLRYGSFFRRGELIAEYLFVTALIMLATTVGVISWLSPRDESVANEYGFHDVEHVGERLEPSNWDTAAILLFTFFGDH